MLFSTGCPIIGSGWPCPDSGHVLQSLVRRRDNKPLSIFYYSEKNIWRVLVSALCQEQMEQEEEQTCQTMWRKLKMNSGVSPKQSARSRSRSLPFSSAYTKMRSGSS